MHFHFTYVFQSHEDISVHFENIILQLFVVMEDVSGLETNRKQIRVSRGGCFYLITCKLFYLKKKSTRSTKPETDFRKSQKLNI